MSFRSKNSFINSRVKDKNYETRNSSNKMKLELGNTAKMDVILQRECQDMITDKDLNPDT